MLTTTNSGSSLLSPAEVGELLILPMIAEAVCTSAATVVNTAASAFRIPMVKTDPSAAWVAEGAEIPVTDAVLDEAETSFSKLSGLTIITSELAADSSPEASEAVGAGLARDLARKLDAAYFGNLAAPAPKGLASLTGFAPISAGTKITNIDPFVQAIAATQQTGAVLDAFVANPADALALALVKKGTGSNEPLLGNDPTQPAQRTVSGVPLLVSPAVAAGTIWGIPTGRCYVVLREDASIETDASVYFTSDRVAVRAKLRAGFLFPHAAAVAKISIGA